MPLLGLGVFQITDETECVAAIHAAFEYDYRHIDTAKLYENEVAVGKAVRESGIDREELFITTKIWPTDFGCDSARRAFETSLSKRALDYVDLYMIHWPVREGTEETWEVMQGLRDEGLIRSIGVSNFSPRRFDQQFFKRTDEVPAVNQFERHAFNTKPEWVAYCRQKGILAEAYCPLNRGQRMDDPHLVQLAEKYAKTSAQILLRHQIQEGIAVIPKSSRPERIRENADIFDFQISTQDMHALDALDEGKPPAGGPEEDWY